MILVGTAIAFVRLSNTQGSKVSGLLIGTLIALVTGPIIIWAGSSLKRGLGTLVSICAWAFIAARCLFELLGVMILIGLA